LVSYGITKLTIEKYLRMYSHLYGIKAVTLRVANPFGERQRIETAQGAVGVFLHNAILGMPITIWGDGSVTRDYIHVSDVAEAFVRAVEYSGEKSCFNISSGVGTSLNELIGMIKEVVDRDVDVSYLPGRPFDVPVNVLNNGLATADLKWMPSISMRDGIARTAEWMKAELAKADN
jgi:UDP-glucose 4-epimerase